MNIYSRYFQDYMYQTNKLEGRDKFKNDFR